MCTPTTTYTSQASIFSAALSTVGYVYFLLSLTSYFAFLVPHESWPASIVTIVPYSMDTASKHQPVNAVWVDILLMSAFTVPHSILARTAVKKWMNLPSSIERPLYILQSSFLLHMQMHFWRNFDGPVFWDVTDLTAAQVTIGTLFVGGFLFLLSASFALDHFHLVGLSQGYGVDLNTKIGLADTTSKNGVVVRWNYSLVSHPIMTGMLTACWATPRMSCPRLLLAIINSTYIVGAVRLLEEPSLEAAIGPEYREYLKTVPRFCPFAKPPTFQEKERCTGGGCPFHFMFKQATADTLIAASDDESYGSVETE